MKIKHYTTIRDTKKLADMRGLLEMCDKEFVPHLSARASTTQASLNLQSGENDGIESYFQDIAAQSAMVAVEKDKVIAFMSFKRDYICEHITNEFLPNLYVTTVIVHPAY